MPSSDDIETLLLHGLSLVIPVYANTPYSNISGCGFVTLLVTLKITFVSWTTNISTHLTPVK